MSVLSIICRVLTDLEIYNPVIINFDNKSIELNRTLLMDYGLVYQMIFTSQKQTDIFGRKLATCILNPFIQEYKFVELLNERIPLE